MKKISTSEKAKRREALDKLAAEVDAAGLYDSDYGAEKPLKAPIPWLVTYRDFERYLSRALNACKQGRVVFFYRRKAGTKQKILMAITAYPDWERTLARAREAFAAGRAKKVRLEDLKGQQAGGVRTRQRRRLRSASDERATEPT